MEERYCADPHCKLWIPLTPENSLAVHPRIDSSDGNTTWVKQDIGDPTHIHRQCFRTDRYYRSGRKD